MYFDFKVRWLGSNAGRVKGDDPVADLESKSCIISFKHAETVAGTSPMFVPLRRVCQNSEIVIENVSAMYGAGFFVIGDVFVSVGPSARSLQYFVRCIAGFVKQQRRIIV